MAIVHITLYEQLARVLSTTSPCCVPFCSVVAVYAKLKSRSSQTTLFSMFILKILQKTTQWTRLQGQISHILDTRLIRKICQEGANKHSCRAHQKCASLAYKASSRSLWSCSFVMNYQNFLLQSERAWC